MAEPTTPKRDECNTCASDPCRCESDVKIALDTLDDLLTADGRLDALSWEELDAIDAWANNVQLDIARHRRVRKPCLATFESVLPGHHDKTHTCDLGADHEPVPHHCPRCNAEWRDPDG